MTDVETVTAARDIAVAAVTTTAANVDLATQQADRAEVARDAAVAPTAAQIATVDADAGSAFRVQQDARLAAPKWKASTAYTAGDIRQAPDGTAISRNANGTSRASFDATEEAAWTSVLAKSGTLAQRDLSTTIETEGPTVGFVIEGTATEAVVTDSKVFLCTLDGVAYARGTVATTTLYSSTDLTTWTTVEVFGGAALVGVYDTFDGEVLVVGGKNAYKSSGWSTNPVTATFTDVVQTSFDDAGFAQASFIPSDVDTWGQYVLLGEYVNPKNNARRVRLSTNHGATFSTILDLNLLHPADVDKTHVHGVAIDGFHTGANPRLWVAYGDGPRAVLYSDNLGGAWTSLTAGDVDPTVNNMMTVTATPAGMVFTTDSNAPDGVYHVARTALAADMAFRRAEIIPYSFSAATLLGFGVRPWRDPDTNLVYITFNTTAPAGGAALPGYMFVSDGITASTVWKSAHTATSGTEYPDGVGKLADGRVVVAYTAADASVRRATMVVKRGTQAPKRANTQVGRESVVLGFGAAAGTRSVAIGPGATNNPNGGSYQGTAVGEDTITGLQGTAIGNAATANFTRATALGASASVTADEGTALGASATSAGLGVAVGKSAVAGTNGTAVGSGTNAAGSGSIVIGKDKTVPSTGTGCVNIGGAVTGASTTQAVAVLGTVSVLRGIAIGHASQAITNSGGVAVGESASAVGQRGLALGYTAVVANGHNNSVALGASTTTTAADQVQIGAKHSEYNEIAADPAAPAADKARLYYRDNGAGKTQMAVRFATGAIQVLATENGVKPFPSFTTAARPAATVVTVGSAYYDTTLSKPAWSDGTNWKDAAGTTV